MDYVCPVSELEQQLRETGEELALPPSSTKDLLDLLDKTEQILSFVGQAPSLNMQGALVPAMGTLISDQLVKHPDVDVKVSVSSCLCEVSRITAPEPPYKDDIMKDIFELNVMAFGELSNVTGRNYYKAIHILEIVAKVKSCLMMLDLECDALILEMFEQFLSRIRINHPETVFSDMESIMTLVLKESDEIASQLLSLLISHVRKENQNVSPAPWQLAEKVLRNCYDTLKPYSSTLMELIEADADEYAEIVATLCQNENEPVVTKPTKTNNIHKRDANTLMHSHSKKQKHIDTQKAAAVSKKIARKAEEIKGKDLEPSQNLNSPHESHSSKGRPKNKKINSNQDSRPKLVQDSRPKLAQDSKEDLRKTRFQDKASNSGGGSSKDKSKAMKKQLTINNTVNEKEDAIISDKKHVADEYPDKDLGYGKQLVGRRIKVWWPLDKMYYEGAVSSYNPLDRKHKVLYADGDEEVLDLRQEKWLILNKSSPHKEQASELPSSITTSTKSLKRKGKRKIEFSPMPENNSYSPKSSSFKTKPTKEDNIKGAKIEFSPMQVDNSNSPKSSSFKTKPTKEDNLKGAKIEFSPMQVDNSNSPKSSSLKTKPTKEDNTKGANSSTNEGVEINDASFGLKLTEKTTDKIEQDGEPIPTTELEEESKTKTETLEENHQKE